MNETKTCADCRLFAPEPWEFAKTGACLSSYEMRRERSGEHVLSYKAVRESSMACPDFEPKEAEE